MSFMRKLSDKARKYLEGLLKEDRYTIDELMERFSEKFPNEAPARSTMGRTKKGWDERTRKMREISFATTALVNELGEDTDDKAGAFMVEGITTLVNHLVLNTIHNDEDPDAGIQLSIKDALSLAKSARELMQARTLSTKQRVEVEKIARDKLISEQEKNLDEAVASKGMTEDQAMFWREKVLGVVR